MSSNERVDNPRGVGFFGLMGLAISSCIGSGVFAPTGQLANVAFPCHDRGVGRLRPGLSVPRTLARKHRGQKAGARRHRRLLVVTWAFGAAFQVRLSARCDEGAQVAIGVLGLVSTPLTAEVEYWKIREELGWNPDIRDLERLIRPDTKLICINNASNPIGMVLSTDTLHLLAKIAASVGAYVLCDEMYQVASPPWRGARGA